MVGDKERKTLDSHRALIMRATFEDPILFFRTFLPHWFSLPISWAHRGMVAIVLRQTDFLLKFGKEQWPSGEFEWTRAELDKIIKFFVWREDPTKDDPSKPDYQPGIPLFILHEEEGGLRLELQVARFTQVVWPRGFGKTTTLNAATIYKVVFRLRRYIMYLSETATHANKQIDNIKRELSSNEALIEVFGVQKPERNDEEIWRQDFFETRTGIAVAARGRGGQVRGSLHRNARPDDIVVDDVEDLESVATEEQRKKTLTWFKADVEPALNQVTKEGTITMIGTLLHREALIPTIMGDPDWISIVFGALAPDGSALWENYMTVEELEKKKLSYVRAGMLVNFYMEYLSKLTSDATAKFKGPFRYQLMTRTEFVGVALVEDPAISDDKEKADFCAFAVTGITAKGQHHVLHCDGQKGMSPRDQIEEYFRLHYLWQPTHHGIEAVAFQKALVHIMREEMFRKAKTMGPSSYFEITPILHGKTGKILRVEGTLAPRYASGYITHQKPFPLLEQQLLDWPNDKKDLPDVVAMCVTLLDPFAALAFDPTILDANGVEMQIDDVLARDQYEALDDEMWGAP